MVYLVRESTVPQINLPGFAFTNKPKKPHGPKTKLFGKIPRLLPFAAGVNYILLCLDAVSLGGRGEKRGLEQKG